MKIFFGLGSSKNRIFKTCEILRKFRKNRKKSQIGPGRSGKVRNRPKPIFCEFRMSLRSKWVIYQPRTTISDDFLFSWSSTIFHGFPGNRIFDDFQNHDIAEGKLLNQGKLIFRIILFLELLIGFLIRWNFGFWVIHMVNMHSTKVSDWLRIFSNQLSWINLQKFCQQII